MAATRSDVDRWINHAKEIGAKYIISVCDTFDYDDYPVYVMLKENLEKEKTRIYNSSMQKINEVITINPDGTVHEEI